MDTTSPIQQLRIGPDLVRLEAGVLVIYSRQDMPDWVVREFCRPVIWFQNQNR